MDAQSEILGFLHVAMPEIGVAEVESEPDLLGDQCGQARDVVQIPLLGSRAAVQCPPEVALNCRAAPSTRPTE